MQKRSVNHTQNHKEITTATLALNPSVHSAIVLKKYTRDFFDQVNLIDLINDLQSKHEAINCGHSDNIENMLFDQANALQAIFSKLASDASHSKSLEQMDVFLRLALKAQAQCNKSLVALHSMKYPSIMPLIKQTNIGANIQVNNNLRGAQISEQKIKKSSNELLEGLNNGKRLDLGTTNETSFSHPHLEAVR